MKAVILGFTKSGRMIELAGMVVGTDKTVVVEITGTLRPHLGEYFRKEGLSEE